jgi:hypothetical protein
LMVNGSPKSGGILRCQRCKGRQCQRRNYTKTESTWQL